MIVEAALQEDLISDQEIDVCSLYPKRAPHLGALLSCINKTAQLQFCSYDHIMGMLHTRMNVVPTRT